jgi:DedD protein
LIGAVAIALLLIVFVPMLLDSETRKAAQEPRVDIPSKENAPPLPAPKPATAEAPKAAAPEAPKPTVPEAPKTAVVEPAKAPEAAEEAKPKVAKVEPKAAKVEPKAQKPGPKMEGFAVQVGAFREEAKLAHAREKLAQAKIASYTEAVGELTRLRAGPFPTRDAAEKAAAKIRAAALEAKVVPLP